MILTKTTQPVQAAAALQFQNVDGGTFVINAAGGPTALLATSGYSSISATFSGFANQGNSPAGVAGVYGSALPSPSVPCGVYGTQNRVLAGTTAGVCGDNSGTTAIGVLGRSGSNAALLNGVGVQGESGGGIGVRGLIQGNLNAIAMYAENSSSYAGPAPGAGRFGVYGASVKGHGLVGATGTAGGAAVVGATNNVPGAFAAAFYGPVVVSGALTVFGAKSAAVPHPDGFHRLLYCVESPESWFEDFGKADLDCGKADVTIDPNFAAVADLSDYHVLVTMYDQHQMLMVGNQTPQGFRVTAENANATTNGKFSWRVVAKRKDIVGERLAKITIPPEPRLPSVGPDGGLR